MKKTMAIVGTLLMSSSLLFGCGTAVDSGNSENSDGVNGANSGIVAGSLEASVFYEPSDGWPEVLYKVYNSTEKELALTFNNGLKVDYILYSEDKKVYQHSENVMVTEAIEEEVLKQGEERSFELEIPNDLKAGEYKLEVWLTAETDFETKQTKIITIPESSGLPVASDGDEGQTRLAGDATIETTGVYIGQVDPHSIEIESENGMAVYQMNEEIQKKLKSIQEGTQIEFSYEEIDTGQKILINIKDANSSGE